PVEPAVGAVAHESLGEGRLTFARPRRHELPVRLLHEAVEAGNALDPCARDPGASEAPIEVARLCAGTRRRGQEAQDQPSEQSAPAGSRPGCPCPGPRTVRPAPSLVAPAGLPSSLTTLIRESHRVIPPWSLRGCTTVRSGCDMLQDYHDAHPREKASADS